jgi:hypothetical protein
LKANEREEGTNIFHISFFISHLSFKKANIPVALPISIGLSADQATTDLISR